MFEKQTTGPYTIVNGLKVILIDICYHKH